MAWVIDYFEQQDGRQPAEEFENDLEMKYPKLLGKLIRVTDALEQSGPRTGGGLIEPCHGYPGLWEVRAIFNQTLAREFFGFENARVVLLHGFVKRSGQPTPQAELVRAFRYWGEYQKNLRVSPEQRE